MTEDEARQRLRSMTAADTDPTLSTEEVEQLLGLARRVDADGNAPTADDWSPTFDLDYAAAEGWRWKAGKVSPDYAATIDGAQLARHQRYDHCVQMAKEYGDRVMGSVVIGRG